MDIAARSAETVNASHTAGRMSRQPRQRQRYLSHLPHAILANDTSPLSQRHAALRLLFGLNPTDPLTLQSWRSSSLLRCWPANCSRVGRHELIRSWH